jgi:prepilin-type processing-associated H-X9-DG protein/prepilin-type N-terminal cleavage/methylation domain-containing protein
MLRPFRRAFTLIELLIVLAVLILLAAILFPVIAPLREATQNATCQSHLRQLGAAVRLYAQEYDGHFPFGGSRPNFGDGEVGTWDWQNTIARYLKGSAISKRKIYRCPSSTDLDEDPQDPTRWEWDRNPVSYLYNNELARNRQPVTESAVKAPSACWLLLDGHSDWGCADLANCRGVDWLGRPNTVWLMEDTIFQSDGSLVTGWLSWQGYTWGLPRHNGGANVCYTDGHVRWMKVTPHTDISVPLGNTQPFYNPGSTDNYLERTYPLNKIAVPGQDDPGAKWNIN